MARCLNEKDCGGVECGNEKCYKWRRGECSVGHNYYPSNEKRRCCIKGSL